MGFKDIVRRITGKDAPSQRGSRGPREQKRTRDESTIQVPTGSLPPLPPPPRPAAPPAPQAAARPVAPPPAPPPLSPPPVYAPAPASATAPSAAAPPPGAARRAGSADATQYAVIPDLKKGAVVGVLVGIDGKLDGEVYRLYSGDNKLGRSQDCSVHMLDPQISREHATVVHEGGVFAVLPLNEKNPVFLNDEPVEEGCELSDGDKLRLGNPGSSSFRFRSIPGL